MLLWGMVKQVHEFSLDEIKMVQLKDAWGFEDEHFDNFCQ